MTSRTSSPAADSPRRNTSEANVNQSPQLSDGGYEAMVFSANLPHRTIAFIYQDGDPQLCGGIFRIVRVRTVTEEDRAAFYSPPADICPLCGQQEPIL